MTALPPRPTDREALRPLVAATANALHPLLGCGTHRGPIRRITLVRGEEFAEGALATVPPYSVGFQSGDLAFYSFKGRYVAVESHAAVIAAFERLRETLDEGAPIIQIETCGSAATVRVRGGSQPLVFRVGANGPLVTPDCAEFSALARLGGAHLREGEQMLAIVSAIAQGYLSAHERLQIATFADALPKDLHSALQEYADLSQTSLRIRREDGLAVCDSIQPMSGKFDAVLAIADPAAFRSANTG